MNDTVQLTLRRPSNICHTWHHEHPPHYKNVIKSHILVSFSLHIIPEIFSHHEKVQASLNFLMAFCALTGQLMLYTNHQSHII